MLFEDFNDEKTIKDAYVGRKIKTDPPANYSNPRFSSSTNEKREKLQVPLKQHCIQTEVDRSLESNRRSIAVIEKYTGISASQMWQPDETERFRRISLPPASSDNATRK